MVRVYTRRADAFADHAVAQLAPARPHRLADTHLAGASGDGMSHDAEHPLGGNENRHEGE